MLYGASGYRQELTRNLHAPWVGSDFVSDCFARAREVNFIFSVRFKRSESRQSEQIIIDIHAGFSNDFAIIFDRIAMDASRLMIRSHPEFRIVCIFWRINMIDALGDDRAFFIKAKRAEFILRKRQKPLAVLPPF